MGNYDAPKGSGTVVLDMYTNDLQLDTQDRQTGAHSTDISQYGAVGNKMQIFMDVDFKKMSTRLANILTRQTDGTLGVDALMKADNVPPFTWGYYPVIMRYTLPGKGIVTREYRLDIRDSSKH